MVFRLGRVSASPDATDEPSPHLDAATPLNGEGKHVSCYVNRTLLCRWVSNYHFPSSVCGNLNTILAVTREPAGRIKTSLVQLLDYNLNRYVALYIPYWYMLISLQIRHTRSQRTGDHYAFCTTDIPRSIGRDPQWK